MKGVFDEFSLLHFAAGIIAYFWGLPILWWLVVHAVFEYVENTKMGMHFINTYIPVWPGGKHVKESFANSMIGDNAAALAGWLFASFVEKGFKFSLEKRGGKTKFNHISS